MGSSGTIFNTNNIPSKETLHSSYSQGVVYYSDTTMTCYKFDPNYDSLPELGLKSDASVSYIKQEVSGEEAKINYETPSIASNSFTLNIMDIGLLNIVNWCDENSFNNRESIQSVT